MAIAPTPGSRGVVTETAQGLELAMPATRSWFVAVFLTVWLVAWFFGEIAAIGQLRESIEADGTPELFLAIWLIGWTIGGAFAALTLLRNLIGTERMIINGGEIIIRNEVFGIGTSRRYPAAEVSNLRVDRTSKDVTTDRPATMGPSSMGTINRAAIAFDAAGTTVKFGSSLSATEAELFVDTALRRYSALGSL